MWSIPALISSSSGVATPPVDARPEGLPGDVAEPEALEAGVLEEQVVGTEKGKAAVGEGRRSQGGMDRGKPVFAPHSSPQPAAVAKPPQPLPPPPSRPPQSDDEGDDEGEMGAGEGDEAEKEKEEGDEKPDAAVEGK